MFHHEHSLANQRWDWPRDRAVVDSRVLERHAELGEVEGLEPEVELGEGKFGEQLDEAGQIGEPGGCAESLCNGRDEGHRLDVGPELAAQARSPDLHDDLAAITQPRAMNLRDRRGGERSIVEAAQEVPSLAKLLIQDGLCLARRQRRGLIPAPFECRDPALGQQSACAGDELAELDVRGTAAADEPLGSVDDAV